MSNKKNKNNAMSVASVVVIGVLTSFFILRIAEQTDALVIDDYFKKSLVVFVVLIAALVFSNLLVSKFGSKSN